MKTIETTNRIKMSVIFSAIGLFMMLNASAKDGNNIFRKFDKTEAKEELTVENWMYDLSEWKGGENEKSNTATNKTENKIEIIAASEFNAITKDKIAEDEIILEDWMMDANNKFWSDTLNENTEVNSEEIEIEEWMTDLSKW